MAVPEIIKEAFARLMRPEDYPEVLGIVLLECKSSTTENPVYMACLVVPTVGGVETIPVAAIVVPTARDMLIPPTDIKKGDIIMKKSTRAVAAKAPTATAKGLGCLQSFPAAFMGMVARQDSGFRRPREDDRARPQLKGA